MLIWSGKGILSVLVLLLSFVVFISVFPQGYFAYAFSLPFLVTGIFSWVMGRKWNRENGRILVDKDTGQEFQMKPNHSLFWIKLQYWGPIFFVIGLLVMLLFNGGS